MPEYKWDEERYDMMGAGAYGSSRVAPTVIRLHTSGKSLHCRGCCMYWGRIVYGLKMSWGGGGGV